MTQKAKRGFEIIPVRPKLWEWLESYSDDTLRQNTDLTAVADELEFRRVDRKLNSNKEQKPKHE